MSKRPKKAKAGITMDALMERHIKGKPVASAFIYDRKDMNVRTPAERIKLNPRKANIESATRTIAAAGADNPYEFYNSSERRGRRERYHRKLQNGVGLTKIVSEGDSWHLYPILIREIIDHLNDDPKLAIFSTDGAGDTLDGIWSERLESNKGFQKSIAMERPSVFLFNGGGNDLLQGRTQADGTVIGNLYFHLKTFSAGMSASDLVSPSIEAEYDAVERKFRDIIQIALQFSFLKKIVFHGYDYPFPANDVWFGKPMAKRGITSPLLQRQICILLMDKLHERLKRIQQSFASAGKVAYVDVRNTVTTKAEWDDELHPKSPGFKKIAAKIRPFL
jgi:lysophospholipase L1-like esterase